eukprot:Tbor_TRINITY_DN3543_c0_g1::TRINITY_DN3543_c0_g1_i1::g.2980::m.2980
MANINPRIFPAFQYSNTSSLTRRSCNVQCQLLMNFAIYSRFYSNSRANLLSSSISNLQVSLEIPFCVVYVINLIHRTDRWEHIVRQLNNCGIPRESIRRFTAINGHEVSPERLHRNGYITKEGLRRYRDIHKDQKIWGMDLSPGAIGCAMSHFHLWGQIAMTMHPDSSLSRSKSSVFSTNDYRSSRDNSRIPLPAALIIEDDSLFKENFITDLCNRWAHVPDDWELIYLSGLDTAKKGHLLEVPSSPGFRYVHPLHRTTNCYIVDAKGAKSLLDVIPPITFQLDTEMTMRTSTGIFSSDPRNMDNVYNFPLEPRVTVPRCYTIHPPIVVQATRFGSDIQDGNPAERTSEERSRMAEAGWTV